MSKNTILTKWTPHISSRTSPGSDNKSKIVKKGRQIVYKVYQGNYLGLFINLGLPAGSFWQEVRFFVKVASANQPGGIPLILTKIRKLLESVDRMLMMCINVIIRDYSLI